MLGIEGRKRSSRIEETEQMLSLLSFLVGWLDIRGWTLRLVEIHSGNRAARRWLCFRQWDGKQILGIIIYLSISLCCPIYSTKCAHITKVCRKFRNTRWVSQMLCFRSVAHPFIDRVPVGRMTPMQRRQGNMVAWIRCCHCRPQLKELRDSSSGPKLGRSYLTHSYVLSYFPDNVTH